MDSIIQDLLILAKPALFNLYFALVSIPIGFPLAVLLALAKASPNWFYRNVSSAFIYAFRGSPLFIQFFMFYAIFLSLNKGYWKPWGIDDVVMHPLFIGPLVLILNTAAYAAEIFFGALKGVPKGEIEAAKAVGMTKLQIFRLVKWPNMLRLAWPAYTNEIVFLFHATTLVYFTLPVIDEQKDLMNKAGELFEKDYNLFLHFSVAAFYFLMISLVMFWVANQVNRRLNKHKNIRSQSVKIKPSYIR